MSDLDLSSLPARQGTGKSEPLTMSTREIAELTGKRHDNVVRDARNMLTALDEGTALSFEDSYRDATGRRQTCLNLPKRECVILVSGYDVTMRARIIDRWMELEARHKAPDPIVLLSDPAVMRGLLLTYADKVLALEADKAVLEPKAAAHDRIADLRGTFTRTAAAKILGVPPNVLMTWMANNGWTYTRTGGTDVLAHQAKLNAGLLENKIAEGRDGATWRKINVHVTPKGLTVLAKAFPPLLQIAGAA